MLIVNIEYILHSGASYDLEWPCYSAVLMSKIAGIYCWQYLCGIIRALIYPEYQYGSQFITQHNRRLKGACYQFKGVPLTTMTSKRVCKKSVWNWKALKFGISRRQYRS